MKITDNLYVVPGVVAHSYLLVDGHSLTLIDTGIPGSQIAIILYIRRLGFSPRDVSRILITHADWDHAGGLAALKRATGARVYASRDEARAIAAGRFPRSLHTDNFLLRPIFYLAESFGRTTPSLVDEIVVDGQMLPVLNGLQVLDTKGHTPGHLSFFAPALGALFTGDSILSLKDSLVGSHGSVTWDQKEADAAVRKQLSLRAQIVCSGHGVVVLNGLSRFFKLAKTLPV